MKTPFSIDQFFSVFENYNNTLFPAQIILFLAGLFALYWVMKGKPNVNRFTGAFLGFIWVWMGIVYHICLFSKINPPALVFGVIFILQGVFILFESFRKNGLDFTYSRNIRDNLAVFFIVFGLIIYPVISYFMENEIAKVISFGLPCPTTITTFGFFMLTAKKCPTYLLIIPGLWAVIGTSAAVSFGVYQDFMLIIAAITAIAFILIGKKRSISN